MALFAISDLHLSFNNPEKSMEIFEGWSNYTQKLEKNWRKLIKDDDEVVIAGDISWALKLNEAKLDLEFLNSLPGKKLLIKGNHDLWWGTKKKLEDFFEENNFDTFKIIYNSAYETKNFVICGSRGWLYDIKEKSDKKISLREAARLERSIIEGLKLKKDVVVFMHYPPVYGGFENSDIINVLKKYNIKKCYFGHVHGNFASKVVSQGEYSGIKMQLISADYLKFMPEMIRI